MPISPVVPSPLDSSVLLSPVVVVLFPLSDVPSSEEVAFPAASLELPLPPPVEVLVVLPASSVRSVVSVVFPLLLVGVPVPSEDADGVKEGSDEGTKEGDKDGDEDAGTTGLGVITVATGADVGAALVGALEDGAAVVGLNDVGCNVVGASVCSTGVSVGASVATTGANVGDAVGPPPPPPPCDVGLAVGKPVKLSASHPYCPGVASVHRRLDSSVASQGRNSTPVVPAWTRQ